MAIYRDDYPNNIEAPQRLYIQYSHDIDFDYSTDKFPSGTESEWDWENKYTPISHDINGREVGRHEWLRIKIGNPNQWTVPIRVSANVTNIDAISTEVQDDGVSFSFAIILTFADGSTVESNPVEIKNGQDGVEIISAQINVTGRLIITYSDGTIEDAGQARGQDGEGVPPIQNDDYVLSQSGGVAVWIPPLQALNNAATATLPIEFDFLTGDFSHNLDDGNRHIPIGGSSGSALSTDGSGTYTWEMYYTQVNLQTSGQASVHWDNITNEPNFSLVGHTHVAADVTDFASTLAGTTNVTMFTPTTDYHVATKKYVDDLVGGVSSWDATMHLGNTFTILDTENLSASIIQNDVTNNPVALAITNTGTGSSIAINGTEFLVEGDGTLSVAGVANYETLVLADDDIPNKKYVDDEAASFVETDPLSLHLDQTSPQTFTAGTVTGSGLLKVTSGEFGLGTPYTKTITISPAGGDYTTIQAALTANHLGGELFLVYPGTYVNDTINFTANDQDIVGVNCSPKGVTITKATTIVDYGAFTDCVIDNLKMIMTLATNAVGTVVTGTGSCNFNFCHVECIVSGTNADTNGGATCYRGTGDNKIVDGSIVYTNTANRGGRGKKAILIETGSSWIINDVTFTVTGSGTSSAHAAIRDNSNGDLLLDKSSITISDNVTTKVYGANLDVSSGEIEISFNRIHATNTGGNATAILVGTGTSLSVRSMYNHLHAIASGTANAIEIDDANTTFLSQYDDLVGAVVNSGGTYTQLNSPSDGDFAASGTILANTNVNIDSQTASEVAGFDASKNIISLPVVTYPSLTELTYLKGATSTIQTQIDSLVFAVAFAASALDANLAAAVSQAIIAAPEDMTITQVFAKVGTAPTGSTVIVDINVNGGTILSTKISIDISEKTSLTAAVPPVISSASLTQGDEIIIDIDQVGATITGKDLTIYILGTKV